ncbi:MAG: hypothetical protein JWO38_5892 [Gemmataceae bacterium]|nr:hypothetical protein [Gemmataceae bacterium]
MNAPLYVTPQAVVLPPVPGGPELADLLRQLLEVQREQLSLLKAQQAAQDSLSRWRAFLNRWTGEFPEVGGTCKQMLPLLERAYLSLIRDLTDRLKDVGNDLDDEFVMTEFLDRYGVRLTQLGNILTQLSPIADAAPATDAPTA